MDLDRQLQVYAELAVKVALNLQPGQRLLIIGPLANGGASLEAAPLARQIAAAAYRAGSPLVETLYGDEAQQSLRFKHAPRESFGSFSAWLPKALSEHVAAGHAVLSISANDPDLLQGEPADLVSARPAGDRARDAAVSRADFAQRHQLGDRRGGERRLGRKNLSRRADGRGGVAALGCHRAHVPARCARSARGVGNAPRQPRRAQRVSEQQAVLSAEVHRARAPISRSVFLTGTSGSAAAARAATAFRLPQTCRPKKCSPSPTRIASTAPSARRSRSATAAR